MDEHEYSLGFDPEYAIELNLKHSVRGDYVMSGSLHRIKSRHIGWVETPCGRGFHAEPPRLLDVFPGDEPDGRESWDERLNGPCRLHTCPACFNG